MVKEVQDKKAEAEDDQQKKRAGRAIYKDLDTGEDREVDDCLDRLSTALEKVQTF